MLKQIYKYTAAFLLLEIIASCSSDPVVDEPLAQGDVPIQLSGALTRALGEASDPGDGKLIKSGYPLETYSSAGIKFYLTARTVETPVSNYFLNKEISIGDKNTTDQGRNKLTGTVYYPLGKKAIDLYAHTAVTAAENGNITLTAGTGHANDVLLGRGTIEDGSALKSGQSDDPVEYITFKHLMTRVDVRIEVDDDVEATQPTSVTMRFFRSGVNGAIVDRGTYNIFNGGNATNNASAEYSFSNITTMAQTHYLVPNEANLTTYTGQIFSSLTINEYTASLEDLQALKFSKAKIGDTGAEVDFELKPGLAYDLVFKINRLKITEIKLTLKDWKVEEGTSEWGYEPKTMTLSTGGEYNGSDITKMVLKYAYGGNTYQYIGEGRLEGGANKIDFVTLPANLSSIGAGTLTADLYTKDGLLVDGVEIDPSGTDGLNVVNLGKYGTKKNGDIYEISTPLQFVLMVNDAGKDGNIRYALVNDLDMNNNSVEIIPTVFSTGSVLDGAGHDILNLNIEGNGLFTVNNGVLKNFRIASGQITGSGTDAIGAICQTNNGIIEAVVNEANIQPAADQTIAGGISGINGASGKISATVNTGNILGGTTVGGIAGVNQNTSGGAITACLNVGMLNKNVGNDGDLGGIVGASESGTSIVNTSFWLTGTARKNQAVSEEVAIGNNPDDAAANSADLAASVIRGAVTIEKLNDALTAALSPWEFELNKDKSSWPIAKPRP